MLACKRGDSNQPQRSRNESAAVNTDDTRLDRIRYDAIPQEFELADKSSGARLRSLVWKSGKQAIKRVANPECTSTIMEMRANLDGSIRYSCLLMVDLFIRNKNAVLGSKICFSASSSGRSSYGLEIVRKKATPTQFP